MNLNIQDMLAKVQEMQARMAEVQETLKNLETTVEVGGGMVKVTITGKQEVKRISIEKSAVSPDDVEMLEDLLVAAADDQQGRGLHRR